MRRRIRRYLVERTLALFVIETIVECAIYARQLQFLHAPGPRGERHYCLGASVEASLLLVPHASWILLASGAVLVIGLIRGGHLDRWLRSTSMCLKCTYVVLLLTAAIFLR